MFKSADNPFSTNITQQPGGVSSPTPAVNGVAAGSPVGQPVGLMDKFKGMAGNALTATTNAVGNYVGGLGNQWDRAKTTYGFNRLTGKNPLEAGLKGFGQLDQSTRGLAGGGLGLVGSAMLAPKGMRSIAMPLATGAGAMFASAHGPDGFKWENMTKPDSLIAGGLGLGAGYLGSKLLGDGDEEDDEDPRHHGRPQAGGGMGMLPALGIGALGVAGGMGLSHYMNGKPAAPTPPVTTTATPVTTTATAAPKVALPPAPPAAPAPAAPPASPVAPGTPVDRAAQTFNQNPGEWANYASQSGELPKAKENLGNLVSQYRQSEAPGMARDSNIPQLSSIYHFVNANPSHPAVPAMLAKAQSYVTALDAAHKATNSEPWHSLDRLEGYRAPEGKPGGAAFGVGGLESLGAFGFKNLDDLAGAAAKGDPRVIDTIKAMGPDNQRKLLSELTEPGYAQSTGANKQLLHLPAASANPRAAALLGAVQAGSIADPIKPEPYDVNALGQSPDLLRSNLTPGQKIQLMQHMRDPQALDQQFGSLSPELRQQAARNVGGLFSRNARGVLLPGSTEPAEVPNWLDEHVQQGVARIAGNPDFAPVKPHTWRDLAAKGMDSSRSLSPYADPATKAYRSPDNIMAGPAEGYSPLDIVLNRNKDNDLQTLGEWAESLTSRSMPGKPGVGNPVLNRVMPKGELGGPVPSPEQNGPLAASLRRLAETRPELYDQLVAKLNQNAGKGNGSADSDYSSNRIDWKDELAKLVEQPGLNSETGQVHAPGSDLVHNGRTIYRQGPVTTGRSLPW